MSGGRDMPCKFQLGPPEPLNGPNIPRFLLERQFRFQDDYVLRPANGHSLRHDLWGACIGTVEVSHSPQAPRREPSGVRVFALQVLCCGHSRAFFRPAADQAACFTVQLHLRQVCHHQGIQRREQGAVIGWFPDIHGFSSFLALWCRILNQNKEKHGKYSPRFSLF